MKFTCLIIVSLLLLLLNDSSRLTYGYNYVLTKQWIEPNNIDSTENYCVGEALSGIYQNTHYCNTLSNSKTICSDNGTVVSQIVYSGIGCTGAIQTTIPITANVCQLSNYVECVESISDVPSNSFVEVTTRSTCEDDPNWKHEIDFLTYMLLDTCIPSSSYTSVKATCNSTVPVFNIYNSTVPCSGEITGYVAYHAPTCTKENPKFAYC